MKSIYKKLSVGVLAAALLAGGSGLIQGGQAFAELKVLDKDEVKLDKYLKEVEEKEPGFIGYINKSNRRLVARAVHGVGLKVMEGDRRDIPKVDKVYGDGWDLDGDIDSIVEIVKSKGECNVKVRDLYFKIKR